MAKTGIMNVTVSARLGPADSINRKYNTYATAVHITAKTTTDPQAFKLGILLGQNHRAGKINPKVAPNWLPVAVAIGGTPIRYFLVKLAASA